MPDPLNSSLAPLVDALVSRRGALAVVAAAAAATAALFGRSRKARAQRAPRKGMDRWAVFYGLDTELPRLAAFDTVILDPGFAGSVERLTAAGTSALGYLSLGEIKATSPLFAQLEDRAALLDENPNWPGTYAVDVRHPAWRKLILEKALPALRARGFSGLFIDTLDMPPYLEETDPVRFRGMTAATTELMQALRKAAPDMPIVVNRGYAVLPSIVGIVDAVVAESLLTTYLFTEKRYDRVDSDTVERHLALLRPAKEANPPVPVFSLDYWNPADTDGIRLIYQQERALGHRPYVATILLDDLIPEPA